MTFEANQIFQIIDLKVKKRQNELCIIYQIFLIIIINAFSRFLILRKSIFQFSIRKWSLMMIKTAAWWG
ncbi:hypothetical protein ACQZV8_21670, partial [Magnetococcales bacterium HHB-1]